MRFDRFYQPSSWRILPPRPLPETLSLTSQKIETGGSLEITMGSMVGLNDEVALMVVYMTSFVVMMTYQGTTQPISPEVKHKDHSKLKDI